MKKYLAIFGIGYGLSKDEINSAYKKMAMKYHPDRNHGFKEEAEKKMKELNEARDYLLNNFDEYSSYNGESFKYERKSEYREEKKQEKRNENKNSKKEEKNHFEKNVIGSNYLSNVLFIFNKLIYLLIILGFVSLLVGFILLSNRESSCLSNSGILDDSLNCVCKDGLKMGEDGKCKKEEKVFDDGNIVFNYPGNIIVTNEDFKFLNFFEKENIFVKKYNLNSIMNDDFNWNKGNLNAGIINENEYNNELKEIKSEYKNVLANIRDGKSINQIFSHYHFAINSFSYETIKIDGINGVLMNYYYTDDSESGCLSQFYTELLLVKDYDNIYSILFQNNFGGVINYLQQYNSGNSESCLINNGGEASKIVLDFYKYGNSLKGTEYESFENNYKIIKDIINTVKIK